MQEVLQPFCLLPGLCAGATVAERGVICNCPLSTPPCLPFPELPIPVPQSQYTQVPPWLGPSGLFPFRPSHGDQHQPKPETQPWEESKPGVQQEPCLTFQEAHTSLSTRPDLHKSPERNPSHPPVELDARFPWGRSCALPQGCIPRLESRRQMLAGACPKTTSFPSPFPFLGVW